MILKSRLTALRVVPVAVVLLAASAGFATAQASTPSTAPKASTSPTVVGTSLYVSPFGSDTSNTCQAAATPCATVQQAVSLDHDGGTINLAAGGYVEQVTITQSLIIVGAGQDNTTIEAPATLAPNTQTPAQNAIVDISGGSGTTVFMSKLTVAGPGATGVELDKGIDVRDSATLNLSSAAVRNVYDVPASGGQHGDGISIGGACFSCADVGHATLTGVTVSVYQKNGVVVRGSGSTLHMTGGRVTDNPNANIASNGIEIVTGAVAVVNGTSVSGNECNDTSAGCGPSPFTDVQDAGVLILGSGAGTQISGVKAFGNDEGIYTDSGVKLTFDNASGNRYVGIFVSAYDGFFGPAANALVQNDIASSEANGIITTSGDFNKFLRDTAGSSDGLGMDAVIGGADTNSYANNHCTSAFPSAGYWHCT